MRDIRATAAAMAYLNRVIAGTEYRLGWDLRFQYGDNEQTDEKAMKPAPHGAEYRNEEFHGSTSAGLESNCGF